MNFVEFVGFVISLTALIFLALKRFFETRQQRLNPEEYRRKELLREENLRKFMRSRGIIPDEEEDFSPGTVVKKHNRQPPPAAPQKKAEKLHAAQKTYLAEQKKAAANVHAADSYEVIRIEKISSGARLIGNLKSPQEMLVIKEIFDKPLSMREFPY